MTRLFRRPAALALLTCFLAGTPGRAAEYRISGDVAGQDESYTIQKKDTLYRIARRYDVGIRELMAANPGVDPWVPKPGRVIEVPSAHILPAVREDIVIDVARLRLFYFLDDRVLTFPIGAGKQGWATPTGRTKIALKRKDPVWRPPPSIRKEDPTLPEMIPAGPDNPMGAYAMNLAWPGYAIHGTNRPYGVGKRSSHGCIRLYPEDISALFQLTPVGTSVTVVREPVRLGWQNGTVWLEVSPGGPVPAFNDVYAQVSAFAGQNASIDWQVVRDALKRRDGILVGIGRRYGAGQERDAGG